MAMDQYLYIPFLGGWTSIYQLFWCSPGVQGFDPLPYRFFLIFQQITFDQFPFWVPTITATYCDSPGADAASGCRKKQGIAGSENMLILPAPRYWNQIIGNSGPYRGLIYGYMVGTSKLGSWNGHRSVKVDVHLDFSRKIDELMPVLLWIQPGAKKMNWKQIGS